MLEKQFVVSCNTNKFFWQQDFQITVKKKISRKHMSSFQSKTTEITCYTVLWSNCNDRLVIGFTTTYTISAYNY